MRNTVFFNPSSFVYCPICTGDVNASILCLVGGRLMLAPPLQYHIIVVVDSSVPNVSRRWTVVGGGGRPASLVQVKSVNGALRTRAPHQENAQHCFPDNFSVIIGNMWRKCAIITKFSVNMAHQMVGKWCGSCTAH
jgi:hypothetical protein